MRHAISISILTLLALCCSAQAKQLFREFTGQNGQTMNARPVAVIGQNIRIERDDGAEFTVDPSIFSEKDQKFLKEWRLRFLMDQGRLFKINTKQGGSKKEKMKMTGMETWSWKGYYEVTIENRSDLNLKDIRVEYVFFKFDDQEAAQKRSSGRIEKETGEQTIKFLSARKTNTFNTSSVNMRESELDSNYYYVNGGDDEAKDRLEGIHLKVFVGDLLIAKYSDPDDVLQKMK